MARPKLGDNNMSTNGLPVVAEPVTVKHTVNIPGGMYKMKDGSWVDGQGKSLDPVDRANELSAQIAELQSKMTALLEQGKPVVEE